MSGRLVGARTAHNRCLPKSEKLWAHATEGAPLGEIEFALAARPSAKARTVRQQLWSRRIELNAGKDKKVTATCIVAREYGAPAKAKGFLICSRKTAMARLSISFFPGKCACGRGLTIDELVAIFPSRKRADLKPYLEPLNKMMTIHPIASCLRKAHALAQIGHESGSLAYRAEVLPKGRIYFCTYT